MRSNRGGRSIFGALTAAALISAAAPASADWDPLIRSAQYYGEGWANSSGNSRHGSPRGLVVADFDSDGLPDVAVADRDGVRSFLLHTRDPRDARLYPGVSEDFTGVGPKAGIDVAVADFDADGKSDLVSCYRVDQIDPLNTLISVGYWTGLEFEFSQVLSTYGAQQVAAGDVNNDGRPDVVVGGFVGIADEVGIYVSLGTPDDSLSTPVEYWLTGSNDSAIDPRAMVLADATGDGILDVVLSVNSHFGDPPVPGVYIMPGNNTGAFPTSIGPIAAPEAPDGIVVAHLNGDAIPDIAITCPTVNQVYVYVGTGGGAFQAPVNYASPNSPGSLAAGDVDNDGNLDLVAVTKQATVTVNSVAVFKNTGAGVFIPAALFTGLPGAGECALVDVDEDGDPDLVAATFGGSTNSRTHSVGVLRNDGTGGFSGSLAVAGTTPSNAEVVADFNRDGIPDLALGTASGVSIAPGQGNGTFAAPVGAVFSTEVRRLRAGDFDRDGYLDFLTDHEAHVDIHSGDAFGGFTLRPPFFPGLTLAVCDMNRDGALDFLTYSAGIITPALSTMLPWTYIPGATVAATVGANGAATGDWNRDGILDVALAGAGGLATFQGLATGALGPQAIVQSGRAYTAVCAADFNQDGKLDLAAREDARDVQNHEFPSRGIDVFLGAGNGTFTLVRSFGTSELTGTSIASWDANLDGWPDLIVAGITNAINGAPAFSSVDLFMGGGAGEFGMRVGYALGPLTPGGASQRPLTFGDVDRNSVPDILAATPGGPTGTTMLSLLATPPARGNALRNAIYYPTLTNPGTLAVGDLNRDGAPDVVTGSFGSNPGVAVMLGNGGGTLGASTTLAQSWNSHRVRLADFNRDGILDIAASNHGYGAPRVSTMLGVGNGTFGSRNDYLILAGNDFEIGDFNRDAIPDVVTSAVDSVRVLHGTGTGTFVAGPSVAGVGAITQDFDLVDLNGDGVLDIVAASGTVKIAYGTSFGTISAPITLPVPAASCQTLAVADVNRDGAPDIIANAIGNYYVLWGGGPTPFTTYAVSFLPFGAMDLRVGEAEANGVPYLYVSKNVASLEVVAMSPAGVLTSVGSYVSNSTAAELELEDFDRDGGLDVVTTGYDESFIAVHLHGLPTVTSVETPPHAASRPLAALRSNAPNPFNPATTIRFWLREPDRARVEVFDVRGRLVTTLAEGAREAGEHAVRWKGEDRRGAPASSGVYFYRLTTASGHSESKRMVLVK